MELCRNCFAGFFHVCGGIEWSNIPGLWGVLGSSAVVSLQVSKLCSIDSSLFHGQK